MRFFERIKAAIANGDMAEGEPPDVLPDAPVRGIVGHVAEWLESQLFDARPVIEGLEYTTVLSERSVNGYQPAAPGRKGLEEIIDPDHYERACWLGGPAANLDGPWPRRPDGIPLAHVATFDLADTENLLSGASIRDWEGYSLRRGLPEHGLLQIFHDLETYGDEPQDGEVGGWQVVWTNIDPDTPIGLVDPPEDLDTPSEVCQALYAHPGISVPSPEDHLGRRSFDAVHTVYESWNEAWVQQRFARTSGWDRVPYTHLYGHAHGGDDEPVLDVLPEVLPLGEGDEYRLIADIESWTALNGWFGDACPLQVWMRQSDLQARAFDKAWCFIRTGV